MPKRFKEDADTFAKERKAEGKETSRWDLDQGKRADQQKGIYDWSRKTY